MTKALQIIHNEHRDIAQALACLDVATRDLRGTDTKPDLELLFTLVYYMRLFPGRLHHPKEEHYLFRALSRREPGARQVIDELIREHVAGEDALCTIEHALKHYDGHYPDGLAAVETAVRGYLDLERRHMVPLAERSLTAEDWEDIDNAFAKNALSLFSNNLAIGFEGLRRRIDRMLEAAHPAAAMRAAPGPPPMPRPPGR